MLFDYLRRPSFNPIRKNISLGKFLKLLLLFYILVIPCSGVIGIMRIFNILPLNRIEGNEESWESAILVLLFAPIVEELLFRLPLRLTEKNLLISISIFLTVVIKLIAFQKSDYEVYFLSIPLFFILYSFSLQNKRIFQHIKSIGDKQFSLVFYLMSFIFGYSHFFNYEEIYGWMVPISFLLILPYILMGLFLGYIRMTYGFIYSVLFHFTINLIPFIPLFLDSNYKL